MIKLVDSDLIAFHHIVNVGDQVLVMRPEGAIHGIYGGTTPDRFNLNEQLVDFTNAAVFPPVFNPAIPEHVLDLIESLDVPRGDHTFSIGIRDFIVARRI